MLNPFIIRAENLPPEERDQLAAEGYLPGGFGEPEPSVVALTVLGAGLAACALLALLSEEGGRRAERLLDRWLLRRQPRVGSDDPG